MEKFCHFVFSGLWIVGQYYLLLNIRYQKYLGDDIEEGPRHQSER